MVFNNSVCDRHPKTGTLANRLGGEKRLENMRLSVFTHAATVIQYADIYTLILGTGMNEKPPVVTPGRFDRLGGIGNEIEEHLVDLRG